VEVPLGATKVGLPHSTTPEVKLVVGESHVNIGMPWTLSEVKLVVGGSRVAAKAVAASASASMLHERTARLQTLGSSDLFLSVF
jgi:hypothetical protein